MKNRLIRTFDALAYSLLVRGLFPVTLISPHLLNGAAWSQALQESCCSRVWLNINIKTIGLIELRCRNSSLKATLNWDTFSALTLAITFFILCIEHGKYKWIQYQINFVYVCFDHWFNTHESIRITGWPRRFSSWQVTMFRVSEVNWAAAPIDNGPSVEAKKGGRLAWTWGKMQTSV